MSARVLVVGVDALEVDLVDRFVAEGRMPTFARLADTAATLAPSTPLDTLPGAIWPELNTGLGGWRTGLYYHPRQLHTGESRVRPVEPSEIDAEAQFWVRAARAGRRVLAVDLPQMVLAPDLPTAVQVREWGVHDQLWGSASEPPTVLQDIERRWGTSPADICDQHGDSVAGFRGLRDALVQQAATKGEWISELVASEGWDLVACSFGEAHCAGHQLLHHHDPENPWHDPSTPPDLVHALRDVYEALDAAIGSVIAAAGTDAVVITVASHGMQTFIGGYQLLDQVLDRLFPPPLAQRIAGAPSRLPAPVRAVAQRVVPASWRRGRRQVSGEWHSRLEQSHTRAIAVSNNRVGGIRLNLVGREPHGTVAPGEDAEAVVATITEALLELRQPGTGEPVVDRVERTDALFGPERHPDLPDLIVVFRYDLGPLDQCESSRLGRIADPVRYPDLPRSGDHTDHARWWLRGPGVRAGHRTTESAVVDLAPTVLELLGVDAGEPCDGRAHDLATLPV